MRDQCFRRSGEARLVDAVLEDRPLRAAGIEGIEDDVACRVEECLDKGPGQVEDHRAMAACPHLTEQVAQADGLARPGGADQHRVALLQAPRKGHAGKVVGLVEVRFAALGRRREPPPTAEQATIFRRLFGPIVRLDLTDQRRQGRECCPPLVAALLRASTEPRRCPAEGQGGGRGDQGRNERAAACRRHALGPGRDHQGVVRRTGDRHQ